MIDAKTSSRSSFGLPVRQLAFSLAVSDRSTMIEGQRMYNRSSEQRVKACARTAQSIPQTAWIILTRSGSTHWQPTLVQPGCGPTKSSAFAEVIRNWSESEAQCRTRHDGKNLRFGSIHHDGAFAVLSLSPSSCQNIHVYIDHASF
jgi:hypothetical protein